MTSVILRSFYIEIGSVCIQRRVCRLSDSLASLNNSCECKGNVRKVKSGTGLANFLRTCGRVYFSIGKLQSMEDVYSLWFVEHCIRLWVDTVIYSFHDAAIKCFLFVHTSCLNKSQWLLFIIMIFLFYCLCIVIGISSLFNTVFLIADLLFWRHKLLHLLNRYETKHGSFTKIVIVRLMVSLL